MANSIPPVDELLFQFQLTHTWDCFGKEVIYDMFTIGVDEDIVVRTSGLDARAAVLVTNILNVVHAIRSIGGYDFKSSFEEKLKFVRAMAPPVFDLFNVEFQSARADQGEQLQKRLGELKKPLPRPD